MHTFLTFCAVVTSKRATAVLHWPRDCSSSTESFAVCPLIVCELKWPRKAWTWETEHIVGLRLSVGFILQDLFQKESRKVLKGTLGKFILLSKDRVLQIHVNMFWAHFILTRQVSIAIWLFKYITVLSEFWEFKYICLLVCQKEEKKKKLLPQNYLLAQNCP